MGKVHRYATMRKYLVLLCLLIFCNTESDSSSIIEVQLEDENFSPATTIQRYEHIRKSGLALVEDKKMALILTVFFIIPLAIDNILILEQLSVTVP